MGEGVWEAVLGLQGLWGFSWEHLVTFSVSKMLTKIVHLQIYPLTITQHEIQN